MAKNGNYISIKEFAKRANVSVQSIYKRLNEVDNLLNQYFKLVDNQKMLDLQALEDIYGIEVEQPIKPNHSTYSTAETAENEIIGPLKEELERAYEREQRLNSQIENLSEALQRQQLLTAQQQTLLLSQTAQQPAQEEEERPKSRWQRLIEAWKNN